MLLFKKFNHVSVIKIYGMVLMLECFVLLLYYVCSYKLITSNKTFNVRLNMCQHKREFYKQISLLLKSLFLNVHVRSSYTYITIVYVHHTICEKCNYNMSIHFISSNDFSLCHKSPTNFLLRLK